MPEKNKESSSENTATRQSRKKVQALAPVRAYKYGQMVRLKNREVIENPWPELLEQAKTDHNLKVF